MRKRCVGSEIRFEGFLLGGWSPGTERVDYGPDLCFWDVLVLGFSSSRGEIVQVPVEDMIERKKMGESQTR